MKAVRQDQYGGFNLILHPFTNRLYTPMPQRKAGMCAVSAPTSSTVPEEIVFSAEIDVDEGEPVELLIDWPVRLNGRITLALVLLGTVLRSDSTGAAVKISRYEWRIRAGTTEPGVEINSKSTSRRSGKQPPQIEK